MQPIDAMRELDTTGAGSEMHADMLVSYHLVATDEAYVYATAGFVSSMIVRALRHGGCRGKSAPGDGRVLKLATPPREEAIK